MQVVQPPTVSASSSSSAKASPPPYNKLAVTYTLRTQRHPHLLQPPNSCSTTHPLVVNTGRKLFNDTIITTKQYRPNNNNTTLMWKWNSLLRSACDDEAAALHLYIEMLSSCSVPPNSHTFPLLLKPAASLSSTTQIHAHLVKFGFGSHVFTLNSLIRAYAASGSLQSARLLFDTAAVSYNTDDTVSWNSIIDAYVKCGQVDIAYQLFTHMSSEKKNVVSWTTIMSGFISAGLNEEALQLFRDMQITGVRPDPTALATAISACAHLGAIDQGRFLHAYIEKNKVGLDKVLCCALIDMYAKCGFMEEALQVFWKSQKKKNYWRCVSIWTAVISGFAVHGRANDALDWFKKMTSVGVEPNSVTWTAVLSACSYAGFVHEGRALFRSMKSAPCMEHYGCMVHLLSRAGLVDEAKALVEAMPMKPNGMILGALLSGCRIHGRSEELGGKETAETLISIDSRHGGRYIQAAGILAEAGDWEGSVRARKRMKESGVRKLRGCSWITVNGRVHEFYASNASHPQMKDITKKLNQVLERLRVQQGYRPSVGGKLLQQLDLEDEEKEAAISQHSEKLAMAFGLITTQPKQTIRIFKNLRVCQDCHLVAKMISKIYQRCIVMRDKSRFHVFKDGICSCNDYW